ncbi:MAG: FAD-dependent oxidoreductase [Alphaproteobacteria bacterium]
MRFPHLFSPFTLRHLTFKNRIISTGHGTRLGDGVITEALHAYHLARARGGAGLIVVEVAGVHETAYYTPRTLSATSDACIPPYRALAKAVQAHECRLFGQLFHAGREMTYTRDGTIPATWSASAVPNERARMVPRPMSQAFIAEIVEGYGAAAGRLAEAGLDGVEILASQGYLLAQFLNPRLNQRTDEYGGTASGRLRFVREVAAAARARIGNAILGIRISGEEPGLPEGLSEGETRELAAQLSPLFDYVSVTMGTVSTLASSVHTVPTMAFEPGHAAPVAGRLKARINKPVFVAGRINRPDVAERILAEGQADMCAMTRGLIADPELPNKARAGRIEDIRACMGCMQACSGHNQRGYSVSCIQYPESGRELVYGEIKPAARQRRVMVVGGGPAGLKAAAIAAARGHDVTLYERASRLGGQVLLAERLPGRMEFGGMVEILAREAEQAGARLMRGVDVDAPRVRRELPDTVILATGARPAPLRLEGGIEGAHVLDAWQVLKGQANVGGSVVVADWRCDWVGLGLAEMLAREGRQVRLCLNGYVPGETIQQYVRDPWIGTLHRLGVEIVPMMRLMGADAESVYFEHTTSAEPVVFEGIETLVTSYPREIENDLESALQGWEGQVIPIGDCLAPRTAEEAVIEGLKAAWTL